MSDLNLAHKHSIHHRGEILRSEICGCFYCMSKFTPNEITEWTDWLQDAPEDNDLSQGETALCPRCGIDSVLGSASGFNIEVEFLQIMHDRWFK